jgi:hypothetical protein
MRPPGTIVLDALSGSARRLPGIASMASAEQAEPSGHADQTAEKADGDPADYGTRAPRKIAALASLCESD